MNYLKNCKEEEFEDVSCWMTEQIVMTYGI